MREVLDALAGAELITLIAVCNHIVDRSFDRQEAFVNKFMQMARLFIVNLSLFKGSLNVLRGVWAVEPRRVCTIRMQPRIKRSAKEHGRPVRLQEVRGHGCDGADICNIQPASATETEPSGSSSVKRIV
jgi:hypothetical protein